MNGTPTSGVEVPAVFTTFRFGALGGAGATGPSRQVTAWPSAAQVPYLSTWATGVFSAPPEDSFRRIMETLIIVFWYGFLN